MNGREHTTVTILPATFFTMSSGNNKKVTPFVPDRSLTVDFDPTAIGLPKDWRLTDFSELKG